MEKVYFIKDKSDANFYKPFVAIYKDKNTAELKMANMKSKMRPEHQSLVTIDSMPVTDYDSNKKSVYIIYDKTDKNTKSPVQAVFFNYSNLSQKLSELRKGLRPYVQKLIYVGTENIE